MGHKTLLVLIVLLLTAGVAYGQGPEAERAGLGDTYYPQLGNSGYDAQHYTIELTVDVATNTLDKRFIDNHTTGLDAALAAAGPWTISHIAEATGLSSARIAMFYDVFAATEKVVTIFSQGANQSVSALPGLPASIGMGAKASGFCSASGRSSRTTSRSNKVA